MNNAWKDCRNLLCIRVDNMGDLMMSGPAIRALKESLSCQLTVLTSPKGKELAKLIPNIDDILICNAPWVKAEHNDNPSDFLALVETIKEKEFDGCVIFTVYSQNPMPAIMLAFLAGIPLRLAYCRENPYHLLTDWVPDQEPYSVIKHQVQRDLDLVAKIGARTSDESYHVQLNESVFSSVKKKLTEKGIDAASPYLIFHCGVSEPKRKYPTDLWIDIAKRALSTFGLPILFTGTLEEKEYIESIQNIVGRKSTSVVGLFSLEEFIWAIKKAALVISVNTSTIHLSSAVKTPMIVLYAQSNPQHTPWNVQHTILNYSIPDKFKSKNEVISYVDKLLYSEYVPYPSAEKVCDSIKEMLSTSLKTAL